jgi:hypothetical protein
MWCSGCGYWRTTSIGPVKHAHIYDCLTGILSVFVLRFYAAQPLYPF